MNSNIADKKRMAYSISLSNKKERDSDSWFTPPHLIENIKKICEKIDLDPFSSDIANEIIGAEFYFSKQNCAFENWNENFGYVRCVYMNPPYSGNFFKKSIFLFLENYEKKLFSLGFVLTNNNTETKGFQNLLEKCNLCLFFNERLKFINVDGKNISNNTRGQCLFLFSDFDNDHENEKIEKKFMEIFKNNGKITKTFKLK